MAYDLQPVKAPRLTGIFLKIFVNLTESKWTRWLVLPELYKMAGIPKLRKMIVEESTTNHPLNLPSLQQKEVNPITISELDKFINKSPLDRSPTIADYAHSYRNGESNPVAVAEQVIKSIIDSDSQSPPLKAFTFFDKEEVITQAKASFERIKANKPLSILDGVPIAVKDELDMVPFPTTVGTKFLGSEPVGTDATVVSKLRAAGALLIGKTNMHEIGIGVTGLNPHHGVVRNPYNVNHHSGGSSSGSAAAVSAGICPGAIGADGGGSIRIPASLCGVVGLKATFGRVSEHGATPLCWSVAHIGPLTNSVDDTAILYSIISGQDKQDSWSMHQPPVHLNEINNNKLSGIKFGVYPEWFQDASPEVVNRCENAIKLLEDAGAEMVEIDIPNLNAFRIAHVITISSEMATAMDSYTDEHQTDFGLDVRINLAMARSFTSRDYIKAQRIRTLAIAEFQRIFDEVDVIITPATASTAPPISSDALPDGESNLEVLTELMRFATMANLTGLPALSIPVGYDDKGLPIGMQFIGKAWEEAMLFRLAKVVESGVKNRKPSRWYQILNTK
jgi:Asp-tRNA(Asn)/Glu-tRNA(Gln) amidotransferase A subunit family amidase